MYKRQGMLWPKLNDQRAATRLAYIGTIKDAVYDQYEPVSYTHLDVYKRQASPWEISVIR